MRILNERVLCRHSGFPVRFQQIEDDYYSYCIQYAGSGQYFKSLEACIDYVRRRFKIYDVEEVDVCQSG